MRRGLKAAKLLCVILAPNIEQGTASGGLDENVAEIIKLARGAEFPVVFALNMRKLGRALGKTIKVSAVALYNADGAHQELRALHEPVHDALDARAAREVRVHLAERGRVRGVVIECEEW